MPIGAVVDFFITTS